MWLPKRGPSYRGYENKALKGLSAFAGPQLARLLKPMMRSAGRDISLSFDQTGYALGALAGAVDGAQEQRRAFNGFGEDAFNARWAAQELLLRKLGKAKSEIQKVSRRSLGFGAFGSSALDPRDWNLPSSCPSGGPPPPPGSRSPYVCAQMDIKGNMSTVFSQGTVEVWDDVDGQNCLYAGGRPMCRSTFETQGAQAATERAACWNKLGPAPQWWLDAVRAGPQGDSDWANHCRRNFPPGNTKGVFPPGAWGIQESGACSWDPLNRQYIECMAVDTTLPNVIKFFEKAYAAMKGIVKAFDPSNPAQWAKEIASLLPFPFNAAFAVIGLIPEIVKMVGMIFSGQIRQVPATFKAAVMGAIETLLPFDKMMIAVNVIIGNIPGAVVAAAKKMADILAAQFSDAAFRAAIGISKDVGDTISVVIRVVTASADLISMIIDQGFNAFKTQQAYQLIGAVISSPFSMNSGNFIAKIGNAIARNAELIATTINDPGGVLTYIEKKYIEPAQAMLYMVAKSQGFGLLNPGASVAQVRGGVALVQGFVQTGFDFESIGLLLNGLNAVFVGLADGLGAIPLLGGVVSDPFRSVGRVLAVAATGVAKAAVILKRVEDIAKSPDPGAALAAAAQEGAAAAVALATGQGYAQQATQASASAAVQPGFDPNLPWCDKYPFPMAGGFPAGTSPGGMQSMCADGGLYRSDGWAKLPASVCATAGYPFCTTDACKKGAPGYRLMKGKGSSSPPGPVCNPRIIPPPAPPVSSTSASAPASKSAGTEKSGTAQSGQTPIQTSSSETSEEISPLLVVGVAALLAMAIGGKR